MIHKFIKRRTLDSLMFAYVMGMKRALPAVTVTKALELFQNDFELTEDEFDIDCMRVTYQRMQSEYIDFLRKSHESV